MTLQKGDAAPSLRAANQHGETVEPSFERPTVVYFYPEDGTPGCRTQAEEFQLERDTYRDAGVEVYGVSTDDVDSHWRFAESLGLEFDLLADPQGELATSFGLELNSGRAPRSTFVILDGEVDRVYQDVKARGHARRLLMDLLEDGVVTLD